MILTTHAIVGGAIASFMPGHPVTAAVLGFVSHFVIDAIPHWDYPIHSVSVRPNNHGSLTFDRALLRDVTVIGLDGLAGALLAIALFASPATVGVILLGAFAAMLPDPLQFVHGRYPHEPLRTLQRFHGWMHSDRKLDAQPALGIGSQVAFALAVIGLAAYAHGAFGTVG
jgi:hypothetical protein